MSKKITTEEWIERAKSVHKDKYDYSLVKYKAAKKPVSIICNKCGNIFSQTPDNHVSNKRGCPRCAGKNLSLKERIDALKKVHGDRYDYSLVEYTSARSKIKIICPLHGVFEQTYDGHLHGKGCLKCKNRNLSLKERISAFRDVHGDKYDYSLVEYKNPTTKVKIICPEHGVFEHTPNAHLNGQGCPDCAITGYSSKRESLLYLLVDDLEIPTVIKVGITNNFSSRFKNLKLATPFPIYVLKVFTFDAGCATLQLEQLAHTVFTDRNCHFEGFDGCTEWFWYSHEILEFVENNC